MRSSPSSATVAKTSPRCAPRRRFELGESMSTLAPTATLARFAAELRLEQIPSPVLRRCEDLLLDWLGSALAGKGARPVEAIARVARLMGPAEGPCEILIDRSRSTPAFAAMVNAASSHFAEQDD